MLKLVCDFQTKQLFWKISFKIKNQTLSELKKNDQTKLENGLILKTQNFKNLFLIKFSINVWIVCSEKFYQTKHFQTVILQTNIIKPIIFQQNF